MAIWFSSDPHFNHDKSFIYEPRGFKNVKEMNETIIQRWNSVVDPEDVVYLLGDVIMGVNQKEGLSYLEQLNGKIHIIIGNHDTNNKIAAYSWCANVESISCGERIYSDTLKKHLWLTHHPMLLSNSVAVHALNLHGHTHSKEIFSDYDYCINVALDAWNCYPVSETDLYVFNCHNHWTK